MISRGSLAGWYRNRYVWVAMILAVSAAAVVLVNSTGSRAEPTDLRGQILARMRTTLEKADAEQHQHAAHNAQQAAIGKAPVVCGVHLYGFEPTEATVLADVRTVYGFHFCGVAEQKRPWDVAVKLAGPLIMDMATDPPGITVVEATAEVTYADRLRQMFPDKYAQLAQKEALSEDELADVRRRYDAAAGL